MGRWSAPWCTHVGLESNLACQLGLGDGPQHLQKLRYSMDSGLESHVTALGKRIKGFHGRRQGPFSNF